MEQTKTQDKLATFALISLEFTLIFIVAILGSNGWVNGLPGLPMDTQFFWERVLVFVLVVLAISGAFFIFMLRAPQVEVKRAHYLIILLCILVGLAGSYPAIYQGAWGTACCERCVSYLHGLPFSWFSTCPDPDFSPWNIGVPGLFADLLFWANVGLLLAFGRTMLYFYSSYFRRISTAPKSPSI
ncbi:MAG: hypothetical protein EHM70_01005 [Chloroflexota bacterium]|nr:MAG: hypothetical protein EHM70_01005 [Chloroflexota bacterium]